MCTVPIALSDDFNDIISVAEQVSKIIYFYRLDLYQLTYLNKNKDGMRIGFTKNWIH